MKKEQIVIEKLRKWEPLALELNPDGFFVAFSGGKDSVVMYDLVRRAGVRHRAFYSVTSIDPPDNVYYIRQHFPEVEFIHPKRNFFKLIETKGLPTIMRRYCCERLKEGLGAGYMVLTGVRAAESRKRAGYAEIEIFSRRVEHQGKPRGRSFEQLMESEHQCIKGRDKLMVRPILDWSDEEVWQYIREHHLPLNPCYQMHGRVGCMFCPFASKEDIEKYERQYPRFKPLIIRALTRYWSKTENHYADTPEEYYEYWKTKGTKKQYIAAPVPPLKP